MNIDCTDKKYDILNQEIFALPGDVTLEHCLGQRFIGAGAEDRTITINGTPGNALGAYLNGARIVVNGNAQDATGDTMNAGRIVIHGRCGDAAGYAMRGGEIFIEGDVGYRAGIHMKAYKEKYPVLVFGGRSGSFLGEYQAGGTIIVLGLDRKKGMPTGSYLGTGMHGGEMYIRSCEMPRATDQVTVTPCTKEDLEKITDKLEYFCTNFDVSMEEILSRPFWKLVPSAYNPYNSLYTAY